jgi:uncharacterized membrane protein
MKGEITMAFTFVTLVLGILLGAFVSLSLTARKWFSRVSNTCLFIMIFCLAAKIGCQEEVIAQLPVLGLRSVAICLGAMAGSFIFMKVLVVPAFSSTLRELEQDEEQKS